MTDPHPTRPSGSAGARPRTLPAAVAPVLAGTGLAASPAGFAWRPALLALVVSLALQVGVNYANDYSDGIRGTDADRVGPLRLVGSGLARPASGAGARPSAASGWPRSPGLALVLLTGHWWLLAVGAACVVAAWFYTGGRRPYGYLGLGEVFVFVFFGLVAVCGTDYVQLGRVTVAAAAHRRRRSARWPARSWSPTTCATSSATPPSASGPWPPGWATARTRRALRRRLVALRRRCDRRGRRR